MLGGIEKLHRYSGGIHYISTATMRHSTRLHSQLAQSFRRLQYTAWPYMDASVCASRRSISGSVGQIQPYIRPVLQVTLLAMMKSAGRGLNSRTSLEGQGHNRLSLPRSDL